MQTRRDFLRLAAMLSGAGFSGLVPHSIQRAYAIEPQPGSTWLDAEHVVILMQENRSFDHALGTLRGVRGFNDPRALRLANGNSVFVQTDTAGNSYAPWRLDIRDTRITWMGSIPHSRHSQVDAWNDGHHDGWIDAKRSDDPDYAAMPLTMGHYTREDLPCLLRARRDTAAGAACGCGPDLDAKPADCSLSGWNDLSADLVPGWRKCTSRIHHVA